VQAGNTIWWHNNHGFKSQSVVGPGTARPPAAPTAILEDCPGQRRESWELWGRTAGAPRWQYLRTVNASFVSFYLEFREVNHRCLQGNRWKLQSVLCNQGIRQCFCGVELLPLG
jgi:hypothetical protein